MLKVNSPSYDEWTLFSFSAKLLVSNEVGKSRVWHVFVTKNQTLRPWPGSLLFLTHKSWALFYKTTWWQQCLSFGLTQSELKAELDFKYNLRVTGQNKGHLTNVGENVKRISAANFLIRTKAWWKTNLRHNQTSILSSAVYWKQHQVYNKSHKCTGLLWSH